VIDSVDMSVYKGGSVADFKLTNARLATKQFQMLGTLTLFSGVQTLASFSVPHTATRLPSQLHVTLDKIPVLVTLMFLGTKAGKFGICSAIQSQ
jgi:hypothetical protein